LDNLGWNVGNSENRDDRGDEQNEKYWKAKDKKRHRQTEEN
jgi:hypothetical protein